MNRTKLLAILLLVIFILAIVFIDATSIIRMVHADNNIITSWEIWHNDTLKLYKIQDGSCTLYIARGYVGITGKDAAPAMVAGPGCR